MHLTFPVESRDGGTAVGIDRQKGVYVVPARRLCFLWCAPNIRNLLGYASQGWLESLKVLDWDARASCSNDRVRDGRTLAACTQAGGFRPSGGTFREVFITAWARDSDEAFMAQASST